MNQVALQLMHDWKEDRQRWETQQKEDCDYWETQQKEERRRFENERRNFHTTDKNQSVMIAELKVLPTLLIRIVLLV